MREYKGSEIRNIAVVGHGASGKTSLVDALAFVSGSSKRHGSVKDGTALTDSPPKRSSAATRSTSAAHSPSGRTRRSTSSTRQGISTSRATRSPASPPRTARSSSCRRRRASRSAPSACSAKPSPRRDPVMFVVSMMDKEHADFDRVYQQIKTRLTNKVIPVEVPVGEGAGLPRRRQPLHEEGAPVQARREDRRLSGDRHPRRSAGAFRQVLQRADRIDLGDGRLAARALSRGRRDLARRSHRRDEGSDEADGALPALLRLE